MAQHFYGYMARFDTPAAVTHAAEQVRDAGYTQWDVISPIPLHGIDAAMGLRRSKVPRWSLGGGILGFTLGMVGIWAMNAWDYPLVVGGKPLFSPMFAFPISYELTILLASFGTLIGLFVICRLPMHYHPVMKYDHMERATDDTFYVVLEARDPKFTQDGARELLEQAGATEITELEN